MHPASPGQGDDHRVHDHVFSDPVLLETALTHRSAAPDRLSGYERLEFLGDRVLGLCVADMLMAAFPEEPEGALSRRLSALVCRDALAAIAVESGLDVRIRLGKGERESGPNPAILADACEAVIGALYCDGGLEAARRFIQAFWARSLASSGTPPKDPKSALQEWAMARGMGLPGYTVVATEGPAHAPLFTIRLALAGLEPVLAEGASRKVAERRAARILLRRLQTGTEA